MWLAATRSSMSAGSAAPALAGAVCACAPRAITAWASAAAPAARNVRRVVCDMRSLLRAPGAPRFECAAEIVERGDEGVERGRPGLVAAAHEGDLAPERRRRGGGGGVWGGRGGGGGRGWRRGGGGGGVPPPPPPPPPPGGKTPGGGG